MNEKTVDKKDGAVKGQIARAIAAIAGVFLFLIGSLIIFSELTGKIVIVTDMVIAIEMQIFGVILYISGRKP